MKAFRVISRLTLAAIAFVLMVISLAMITALQVVGSPAAVGHVAGSIIDDSEGSLALGNIFAERIIEQGNELGVSFSATKEQFAEAAARGIRETRDQTVSAVSDAYAATLRGESVTVDLSPMVDAISTNIVTVEPLMAAVIAVNPGGSLSGTFQVAANPDSPIIRMNQVVKYWWLVLLLALAGIASEAALSRHTGLKRWRVSASLLLAGGLMWTIIGKAGVSVAVRQIADPEQRDVLHHLFVVVGSEMFFIGFVAVVIGGFLLGISYYTRGLNFGK